MKTRVITGTSTGILLLLLLLITIPESCYRKFYKVADNSGSSNVDSTLQGQKQKNKYLILRSGFDAYHMKNVVLSEDHKSLTCTLDTLSQMHQLYLSTNKKKGIPFKQSRESAVLNEVHIYTTQEESFHHDSTYTLDFNKISKIEILEKDKGRTTTSTVISTVEIAAVVAGTIAIITSSSNSSSSSGGGGGGGGGTGSSNSCPYVSTYNGDEFITQGELYPGAVYPQLARNDYLLLKMQPVGDGKLQIKISNEQHEIQNTDLAELMVITHDKNVQMLVDENGKLYSVSKPQTPVAAICNDKNILKAIAAQDDDIVYDYDDTSKNMVDRPVQLSFNKETNSKKAKLILNIKNSFWIDYVINKWTEGYGVYYPQFVKQQHEKPAEKLIAWRDAQKIPLTVSVLTNNGWQKLTNINPVGPLSFRQLIVPFDLSNIAGNTVHVQLSSGFMFWELDYAAIDFTEDENYTIEKLLPAKAIDENEKDVTAILSMADKNYLIQPVIGNITTIDYAYTPAHLENKTQTYVLHSKGYYEYVRDYKNKPNVKFLKQFKNPGALSNYSMVLYKQTINGNNSVARK